MKLQNLILIFLAIALPVIIILSVYIELQVDTARLRARYDDILINAAHETVVAFEINTKNDPYLDIADSKLRDVQAALNVFSARLATSFGATGSNRSYMMSYVPALVFTLYDGYYIYTPTEKIWNKDENTEDFYWKNVATTHDLKSYVHYSRQYVNGNKILTINYSLDNYVAVSYFDGIKYESRAGYLEVKDSGQGGSLDNNEYYKLAFDFTNWYNNIVIQMNDNRLNKIDKSNLALPGETSSFNDEKYDVVRQSIVNNLIQVMNNFGFKMPEFNGDEWEIISNNICCIAFMQGLPVRNYNI